MLKVLLLSLFLITPVYAGNPHHDHTPPPEPLNVPDDGSNHNAILLGAAIIAGVCIYHKCWKPKPVKATGSLVPESPKNEYTYTIKP